MDRTFEVGDKVRFMIYSYNIIMRGSYLYPHLYEDPSPEDEDPRLGGVYTILEKKLKSHRGSSYESYRLLQVDINHRAWTSDRLLRHVEDVQLCPFHVGDKLRFSPVSTGIDLEVCPIGRDDHPFAPTSDRFTVRNVINDFYIQVNNEAGEASNFPFRWDDFRLWDALTTPSVGRD